MHCLMRHLKEGIVLKPVRFLILCFVCLCFSFSCLADVWLQPGQKEALQMNGYSDVIPGRAYHEESGSSMVAVQEGALYRLIFLQQMENKGWAVIAQRDAFRLEQGMRMGIIVELHESPDGRKFHTFRVEADEPGMASRAFTVEQVDSGQWRVRHIEGAVETEEQTFRRWILYPVACADGKWAWHVQYQVYKDEAVDGVWEKQILDQWERDQVITEEWADPAFEICRPFALLEEMMTE